MGGGLSLKIILMCCFFKDVGLEEHLSVESVKLGAYILI